jgi:hypothetical protein
MASPGQCPQSSFLIGLLSGNPLLIGPSYRGSVAMALNDDCLGCDALMNVRTVQLKRARILWCFAVSGNAANDYYQAYSHYSDEMKAKSNSIACLERRASSPGQSTEPCFISDEDATGIPNRKPQLPPVLPLLAWLFLPVVLGWPLVLLALRAARWVHEGFKAK